MRWDILNALKPQRYLEIGCDLDECFNKVQAKVKVGVDPVRGGTFRGTSDAYFAQSKDTFDVIFIDGLHRWMQVLEDVRNSLLHLAPGGVILIHDALPTDEACQLPHLKAPGGAWCGDVWRAILWLHGCTDLAVATLDEDWGIAAVLPKPPPHYYHLEPGTAFPTYAEFAQNRKEWLNILPKEAFLAFCGRS